MCHCKSRICVVTFKYSLFLIIAQSQQLLRDIRQMVPELVSDLEIQIRETSFEQQLDESAMCRLVSAVKTLTSILTKVYGGDDTEKQTVAYHLDLVRLSLLCSNSSVFSTVVIHGGYDYPTVEQLYAMEPNIVFVRTNMVRTACRLVGQGQEIVCYNRAIDAHKTLVSNLARATYSQASVNNRTDRSFWSQAFTEAMTIMPTDGRAWVNRIEARMPTVPHSKAKCIALHNRLFIENMEMVTLTTTKNQTIPVSVSTLLPTVMGLVGNFVRVGDLRAQVTIGGISLCRADFDALCSVFLDGEQVPLNTDSDPIYPSMPDSQPTLKEICFGRVCLFGDDPAITSTNVVGQELYLENIPLDSTIEGLLYFVANKCKVLIEHITIYVVL